MRKRIISIILIAFWMGFIFYNSSQNGDESNSKSYAITNEIKNSIKNDGNSGKDNKVDSSSKESNNKVSSNINGNSSLDKGNIDNSKVEEKSQKVISENMKKFNGFIRKSAHAFEYFVLAILVLVALSTFRTSTRENIILALFIVLLYAVGDEYHQLFVDGRAGRVVDIVIDFTGGIIGVLTYFLGKIICKIFNRKKVMN
ncbi:MAG: VanZ family protein [Clostridium sp.]